MRLSDDKRTRRVHAYLASLRARRLNLRPPGPVPQAPMTDTSFNG